MIPPNHQTDAGIISQNYQPENDEERTIVITVSGD
jgi:hypothetical protein